MTRRFISAKENFHKWHKDSEFRVAYDAPEDEFALAAALINACRFEHDAGAGRRDDGRDAGCCCAAGAWPDPARNAHAGAVHQGDRHEAADQFRSGEATAAGRKVSDPQLISNCRPAVQ